jgi:hypothetical protein
LNIIKQISGEQVNKLVKKGIIKNTHNGYVNQKGMVVGFKLTRHKKYIEDKYANLARKL